jgi:hypothetical protein
VANWHLADCLAVDGVDRYSAFDLQSITHGGEHAK